MLRFNTKDYIKKQRKCVYIDNRFTNEILQKSKLTLVASRPACGKTSFLIKLASNAIKNGNKVAFFSFETPKKCLIYFFEKQTQNNIINYKNLYIFDKLMSFENIYNTILKLDRKANGLDLIIIDQIDQIILSNNQRIEDICLTLYRLANQLNVHFMLSNHLSRKMEKYENEINIISKLKINKHQIFDVIYLLKKNLPDDFLHASMFKKNLNNSTYKEIENTIFLSISNKQIYNNKITLKNLTFDFLYMFLSSLDETKRFTVLINSQAECTYEESSLIECLEYLSSLHFSKDSKITFFNKNVELETTILDIRNLLKKGSTMCSRA